MVCLRNICINTLQKGAKDYDDDDDDNDDDDDDDDNNNNNNLQTNAQSLYLHSYISFYIDVLNAFK
jgi:hypothetical protein